MIIWNKYQRDYRDVEKINDVVLKWETLRSSQDIWKGSWDTFSAWFPSLLSTHEHENARKLRTLSVTVCFVRNCVGATEFLHEKSWFKSYFVVIAAAASAAAIAMCTSNMHYESHFTWVSSNCNTRQVLKRTSGTYARFECFVVTNERKHCLNIRFWKWRQYIRRKLRQISNKLHGVIYQKMIIFK